MNYFYYELFLIMDYFYYESFLKIHLSKNELIFIRKIKDGVFILVLKIMMH